MLEALIVVMVVPVSISLLAAGIFAIGKKTTSVIEGAPDYEEGDVETKFLRPNSN